jgi:lysozyme
MTPRDQLKADEGLRQVPYQDTRGNWTVGYGHLMRNPLPLSLCEALLDIDIAQAEIALLRAFPWVTGVSAARYVVFVNLVFNMGAGGLASFTKMLAAAQRGDWESAAGELLDSDYARQTGARAQRLAAQLKAG